MKGVSIGVRLVNLGKVVPDIIEGTVRIMGIEKNIYSCIHHFDKLYDETSRKWKYKQLNQYRSGGKVRGMTYDKTSI